MVLLVNLLVFLLPLLNFTNILGIDWLVNWLLCFHNLPCNNLTRLPFFFEVPRFEELQDPKISPRREEVGRRTLGDYGGFLLSFFYRAKFQLFTRQVSLLVEKLQKLPLASLQTPSE